MATPQILTRSAVPLLSEGLDAADILECYALVRPAQVHNPMMPSATMTIHKVAIGLRYRPWKMNDIVEESKIREITLEYGPQRMGVSLTQESMPSVQLEQETLGGPDANGLADNTDNSNSTVSQRAFVTWENEGKIYYTSQIASNGYVSAYYMASVTGAVLGKILENAVEYPLQNAYIRGRPRRYQPFVVVDGNDELPPPGYEGEIPTARKTILRSSSDTDFLDYMWYTLAELGVNMNPILTPPTYEVQLVATGVEKVKVGPPDWATQPAAEFYQKLYQCIEAKVTGDYSNYARPTPPPALTSTPSQAPTTIDDNNNSTSDSLPEFDEEDTSDADNSEEEDNGEDRTRSLRADFPGTPQLRETDPPIDALRDIANIIHEGNSTTSGNETKAASLPNSTKGESVNVDGTEHLQKGKGANKTIAVDEIAAVDNQADTNESIGNSSSPWIVNDTLYSVNYSDAWLSTAPSAAPLLSAAPSISHPSVSPSIAPSVYKVDKKDTKTEVDQAQEAADQAKQAAAEAKDAAKTDVDSKAADAAQVAAQAAQKAADATSNAAAQAALEALSTGDGSSMMSVVSPCFSDPMYGIAVADENGTVYSQAYLYIDGSSYYKVNLTYPFLQVLPVEHKLPQPADFAGPASGVDFVDYLLAFLLIVMSIFGFLMLIQQVFGGYVKLVRPLFNFQMWFFDPLHYDESKVNTEEERRMTETRQGRGQAYTFGQDVIPVSMGGKRIIAASPVRNFLSSPMRRKRDENHERERRPLNKGGEYVEPDDSDNDDIHEIEMTEAALPARHSFDEEVRREPSRESAESGGSGSSLPHAATNGSHIRSYSDDGKLVENMDLVKKDHRIREKGLPERFQRDPDLVDMPNLKSTSKVAIPVGVETPKSNMSIGGNTL